MATLRNLVRKEYKLPTLIVDMTAGNSELFPLFGEYDLIAKVEADSYDAFEDVVVSKIRTIEGVKSTKTLARVSF